MLRGANIDSKTGDRRRKVAFWGKLGEFCNTVLTFISRFIDGLKSIAKPSSPNRYKRWSQNTAHISVFYFNTNLSTHYQLHGEAKTLRMCTAISPGQWQPWLRACVLQAFALPFFTNVQYCQALSRFSSWILISTCHGFCGNIRRRMVGPNFGLVSVDDTVPKISGTIGVSRHGPAVPMVCDHAGSSSGWTWKRIQRLFTICMGKPVDSQFGYNLW